MSPALVGHWPFAVEGWPWPVNCAGAGVPTNNWPKALGAVQMDPATSNAKADTEMRPIRDIVHSLKRCGTTGLIATRSEDLKPRDYSAKRPCVTRQIQYPCHGP